MLLIILYIKIAFCYVTLSGNVCQLSSLNSSEDAVWTYIYAMSLDAVYIIDAIRMVVLIFCVNIGNIVLRR